MSISPTNSYLPATTGEHDQIATKLEIESAHRPVSQDPQRNDQAPASSKPGATQAPQQARPASAVQSELRAAHQQRDNGASAGNGHAYTSKKTHDARLLAQLNRIELVLKRDAKNLDIAHQKSRNGSTGKGDGQISWSDIQARITTADDTLRKQLQGIDRATFDKLRGDHLYIQIDELKGAADKNSPLVRKDVSAVENAQASHVKGRTQSLNVHELQNHYTTVDRSGVVTTHYSKGSGAGHLHSAFGVNLSPKPAFPANELELRYKMKPQPGFDWAKGGKIPGLLMGHGAASGGHYSSTASSARLMWQKDGSVIGYVYPMKGTHNPQLAHGQYGAAVFKGQGLQLKAGEWNDIRVRVKLNSIDSHGHPRSDGELRITVNGKSLLLKGVQWRTKDETKITAAVLATFFGGPDLSPKNQSAQFKDVEVTKIA